MEDLISMMVLPCCGRKKSLTVPVPVKEPLRQVTNSYGRLRLAAIAQAGA